MKLPDGEARVFSGRMDGDLSIQVTFRCPVVLLFPFFWGVRGTLETQPTKEGCPFLPMATGHLRVWLRINTHTHSGVQVGSRRTRALYFLNKILGLGDRPC